MDVGEKEIQRTLLELLNQLDGFDAVEDVKVVFLECYKNFVLEICCMLFSYVLMGGLVYDTVILGIMRKTSNNCCFH